MVAAGAPSSLPWDHHSHTVALSVHTCVTGERLRVTWAGRRQSWSSPAMTGVVLARSVSVESVRVVTPASQGCEEITLRAQVLV